MSDVQPRVGDISGYKEDVVIGFVARGLLPAPDVLQFEMQHRRRPRILQLLLPYVNRLSAESVVATVRESLADGEPLSVIRLGDGESRLMGWPEHSPLPLVLTQIAYWFGRVDFTDANLETMAGDLREAIKNADIVGVPRQDQVDAQPDYAKVLKYLYHYRLVGQHTRYVNASLHREMQERDLFAQLFDGLERVTIVTCRDVGEALADRYQIAVVQVPIPEEGNTGKQPTDHWPKRYRELADYFSHPLKGALVLVGAGVLGKVYCAWVKEAGGVGLDIGSVFDGWAGVVSRSYLRGEGYGL